MIPTNEKDNNAESNEHRITELKLEKDIVDQVQHQILKSTITIYEVEDISDNQLQAVARHELGLAFGSVK